MENDSNDMINENDRDDMIDDLMRRNNFVRQSLL
jgi:hypothetical protein